MNATHPDGRPRERLPELDLGAPSADRSVIPGLAELQAPAPPVTVGSTLDDEIWGIGPQEYHPYLQAEVDETHDRVAELELRLVKHRKLIERAGVALLAASQELHADAVTLEHYCNDAPGGRIDELDDAREAAHIAAMECLRAAWGER